METGRRLKDKSKMQDSETVRNTEATLENLINMQMDKYETEKMRMMLKFMMNKMY